MSQDAETVWRDPNYLRQAQYQNSANLAARANIHAKYGRGDWFAWVAQQPDWPTSGELLELGCGPGWFWSQGGEQLPDGLHLTLTDLSPGMVEEALTRARGVGRWPVVEGQTADATALPFETGRFDAVQALHMLYHLPDPAAGLDEIVRVLKPGGLAVIATNGQGNMSELFSLQSAVFGGASGDQTIAAFGLEIAEPMLRARFAEVALVRYPDTLRIIDPADVHAYLTSSPPGSSADADQDAALRRAIDQAFASGGGVLTVRKSAGVFLCRGALRA